MSNHKDAVRSLKYQLSLWQEAYEGGRSDITKRHLAGLEKRIAKLEAAIAAIDGLAEAAFDYIKDAR